MNCPLFLLAKKSRRHTTNIQNNNKKETFVNIIRTLMNIAEAVEAMWCKRNLKTENTLWKNISITIFNITEDGFKNLSKSLKKITHDLIITVRY